MDKYKNINGNSGITGYEIGKEYIIVQFQDKSVYTYDTRKPGKDEVDKMKEFALQGFGLNSFINRIVKSDYAKTTKVKKWNIWVDE